MPPDGTTRNAAFRHRLVPLDGSQGPHDEPSDPNSDAAPRREYSIVYSNGHRVPLSALPDDEHSPEFQDEYRRLWYREAGVRRCNAAMPGGTERQMCDRWPNHDGPHLNAETSAEWGKNAGQIGGRRA